MTYFRPFNRFIFSCLMLLGLPVSTVNAALVNYDEAVDGDFSANPLFILDTAGSNTWKGSFAWNENGFDFDSWQMSLAPLLEVAAYSVTFQNTASSVVPNGGLEIRLFAGSEFVQRDRIDVITNVQTTDVGTVVLPIQTLMLAVSNTAACNDDCLAVPGWSLSTDFEVEIVTRAINPVPVPPAAWLFGSALIGVIGIGKRRKVA